MNEIRPEWVVQECTVHRDVDERNGWLDPGDDIMRDELASAGAEVVTKLFQFCWLDTRGNYRTKHAAMVRFTALSASINPDLFKDPSWRALGKALRVSKVAMSRMATEFLKTFKLHVRRSYTDTARESCSKAAKMRWSRKRKSPG